MELGVIPIKLQLLRAVAWACRPGPPSCDRFHRRAVQGEIERCAFVQSAFSPDAAAVTFDDTLHGRQPDAGSREIPGRMQAFKGAKQFVCKGHVKPGTVVPDEKNGVAIGFRDVNFHALASKC